MTPNAPDSGLVYVFPVRALRRWSTENLTLETAPEAQPTAAEILKG